MRRRGAVPGNVADVVEALIGATYLDGGLENARRVILKLMGTPPDRATAIAKDSKTLFQERIQAAFAVAPIYRVKDSSGPSHDPVFEVEATVFEKVLGKGSGGNKKSAAQHAAANALQEIEEMDDAELRKYLDLAGE